MLVGPPTQVAPPQPGPPPRAKPQRSHPSMRAAQAPSHQPPATAARAYPGTPEAHRSPSIPTSVERRRAREPTPAAHRVVRPGAPAARRPQRTHAGEASSTPNSSTGGLESSAGADIGGSSATPAGPCEHECTDLCLNDGGDVVPGTFSAPSDVCCNVESDEITVSGNEHEIGPDRGQDKNDGTSPQSAREALSKIGSVSTTGPPCEAQTNTFRGVAKGRIGHRVRCFRVRPTRDEVPFWCPWRQPPE